MVSALDVNLVTLASNALHVIPPAHLRKLFSTALTASLLLFQESHSTGLVPASLTYRDLVLPHTLTPLNIPLFSTGRFPIEYDGTAVTRVEKMREILPWSEVLENLRVCNLRKTADVNCGRCEKCVRNILALRVVGVQDPSCFPNTLADADIKGIEMTGAAMQEMRSVIEAAHAAHVSASWLPTIEKCVRLNQRRARWAPVWNPIRQRISKRTPEGIKRLWRASQRLFAS